MSLRAIVFAAEDRVGKVDTYLLCGLSLALAFIPWLKRYYRANRIRRHEKQMRTSMYRGL
jgi:hypothetical protein